tara:strand:- start:469 stop:780 length:312 start_codon:yes stop_codon:yes gene_type:complete
LKESNESNRSETQEPTHISAELCNNTTQCWAWRMSLMHQIAAAVALIAQLQQDKTCVVRLFAVDLPDTNHTKAILGGFNDLMVRRTSCRLFHNGFQNIRKQAF